MNDAINDLRRTLAELHPTPIDEPLPEALRDLAAQGCLDVVLCYSPDRLARKFACQALLIEELTRAGVRVEFVRGPRGDTPEDQLLVQFQGMFAVSTSAA